MDLAVGSTLGHGGLEFSGIVATVAGVSNDVMALKMNRSTLLAEKRTRFLTAVRRTYEDFFHDAYINSSQVYYLRVSPLSLAIQCFCLLSSA
jgi:hypothetical protein